MAAPPLTGLYDLLRAEGFAIGVDDHVRIGRLLACEAAWTPELLRTAVEALVVTDAADRGAFGACWQRWMSGAEPGLSSPAVRASGRAVLSVGDAPQVARAEASEPAQRDQVELSPMVQAERSDPARKKLRLVRRILGLAILWLVSVLVGFAVTVSLMQASGRGGGGSGTDASQHDGSGSSTQEPVVPEKHAGPKVPDAGDGSAKTSAAPAQQLPTTSKPDSAGSGSETWRLALTAVAIAIGATLLAFVAILAVCEARARRRFLPPPWHYTLAVPPAARPVLRRNAIADAAADLTWRAPGVSRELDVARSVAATVEQGGLPTLVHRRHAAAPRYLVLEDTAGGAGRWQAIYDELLAGLAREGVALERYRFVANPEHCLRPGGQAIPLDELVDHADALIMIGDGEAAVDPLDGRRAGWLASLRHIPRRLWINPLPPVRWSVGAHAIAEDTPMEHGAARAIAALHSGIDRRTRPARPYPAAIECAPDTASAVAALRASLGELAFHLVSAVAVAAPPTLAAARWLADVLALELDEQDWLAVATLPWFHAGAWPDGMRDRLRKALDADAPDVAHRVAAVSAAQHVTNKPPHGSAAHLAWKLETADRAAGWGYRTLAARSLRQLAATPLVDQARRVRAGLGLPDRTRQARGWVIAIGAALVVAPGAYRVAAGVRDSSTDIVAAPSGPSPTPDARPAAQMSPDGPTINCPEDMVAVPAGTFRMGSPNGEGDAEEHPAHDVTLSPYCIDRTEVTVTAYTACVRAGRCTPADEPEKTGFPSCNGMRVDRQDHPVNCVDWNQAKAYCARVGRRLPSEAEWEYAARGTDGRTYPWGKDPPTARRLNACGRECAPGATIYDTSDGWETTAPVGSYRDGASPFGALDMAGNVWEWTADWYGRYTPSTATNPPGPETGTARVIRGGGWYSNDAANVRAAVRINFDPTNRYVNVGFRCARGD